MAEKLGAYADIEEKLAFKLLREDPEARLLIYCKNSPFNLASTC